MSDAEHGDDATLTPERVGERVGDRLRAMREARGLTLDEVGTRTRVPLRHLEAIEASNYGDLPSSTYAIGFVRAYARIVGGDEVALARDVRAEVANTPRTTPQYQPYEMADPARVPSRGVAIVAAGLALAVLVLAILYFSTGVFRSASGTAGVAGATGVAGNAVTVPVAAPVAPPAPTGGQVKLTATDEVWLRVYDADNKTLYLGTMKPGEAFDVPAGANRPMINVGRPDKLTVTLNGSAIAPLGTGERAIKDVAVDGASIAARANGVPVPANASSARSTTPRPTTAAPRRSTPTPRASASSDAPENSVPPAFRNAT